LCQKITYIQIDSVEASYRHILLKSGTLSRKAIEMKKGGTSRTQLLKEIDRLRGQVFRLQASETVQRKMGEYLLHKAKDLDLINTLSQAANRGESEDWILRHLARETRKLFHCLGSTVYMLNDDRSCLVMQRAYLPWGGKKGIEKLIGKKIPSQVKVPLHTNSRYREALESGRPQMIADLRTIQAYARELTQDRRLRQLVPAILRSLGIRFLVTIPLSSSGQPIGLMDISRDRPFTAKEVERLVVIARQISLILDQIHSRRELERSHDRYQSLVNDSILGVYRTAPDGRILMANPALIGMLGYSSFGEMAERNLEKEGYEPEYPRSVFKKKLEKEGQVVDWESALIRKDGTTLFVRENAHLVRDEQGKVLYYEGTVEDITQRKRLEETLYDSESIFRLLNEQELLGIIIIQDDLVKYVNQAAAEITGYTVRQALGWKPNEFRKLFHPDDADFVMQQVWRKQKGDEDVVLHYSYRLITRSGRVKWVDQYSNTVIFNGRTADLVTIIDITKRKRAEESRNEIELKSRTTIMNSPTAIFIADQKGRYRFVNTAACQLTGYTKSELLTMSIPQLTYKHVNVNELEDYRELKKGKRVRTETGLRSKNGSRIDVILDSVKLSDNEFIAFCTDITARKKFEEEMKASLREKELLLREVHHRVKNNMQVISSLINFQSDYIRDRADVALLKELQDRIRSMSLVHEKLYRSEDLTQVNFREYVRELTKHLFQTYQIDPNRIVLDLRIAPVSLDIDRAIPCGLLINELLSNCLKHAFPGGRRGKIVVILRKAGEEALELIVKDGGVGLPAGIDVHKTETLGLQLVIILAEEQLHGRVMVERHGGTTFRIQLKV
jgi:PAS domain S-box-containing protein